MLLAYIWDNFLLFFFHFFKKIIFKFINMLFILINYSKGYKIQIIIQFEIIVKIAPK